jgi:hypothetical protein
MIGRPRNKRSETSTVEKERAQMKAPTIAHRNLPRFLGALAAAALLIMAFGAGSAGAAFEIQKFNGETRSTEQTFEEGGEAATQAGSHPFVTTTEMEYNTEPYGGGGLTPLYNAKDQVVGLPAGVVGNPNAVPKCKLTEWFETSNLELPGCPNASALGISITDLNTGFGTIPAHWPVYNMVPGPNEPARFGFKILTANIFLTTAVRNGGDYGVTTIVPNTSQGLPLTANKLELWGNPAAKIHDEYRGECLSIEGESEGICPYNGNKGFNGPTKPFLTLPTACQGPLVTTLRANAWEEPNNYQEASFISRDRFGVPVGIDGCSKLPFDPSLQMQFEPGKADSPAALKANLHVPQSDAPEGLASSLLKKAVITLPQGVSVNTSAASGLDGCSEAQFALHANEPAHCPDASKIGTAKITTPLLEDPLEGALYLAQQDANPFGSLLAAYVVAEGHGVILKQAVRFDLNQSNGQITATFDNIPEQPFEDLELEFFGGPRAVLQLPDSCGTYQASYSLSPLSGNPPTNGNTSLDVNQNCSTGGFNPGFVAGSTNPVGGGYAPFGVDVSRNDGEQNVSALGLTLPKGVAAKIAGVPLCPEPNAVAGTCPAASQVGAVNVAAGTGEPVWVPQPGKAPTAVYLAGPYKGAPYSIVAEIPAQAGPFDLGTVVVRSTIQVNPETAQVSVTSDPFPQILQGIPINYRHIHIGIFRAGFMLNPTNCQEQATASTIVAANGGAATPASRFQVTDCGTLGYQPKLFTRIWGKTNRGAHPKFRAVLEPRKGDANVGRTAVTLPRSEFLDQAHIKTICTRVQFAANACPAASVYGWAKARTPLFDQMFEGPVYLRSSNHKLPDMVAALKGPVAFNLVGRIDSKNKGIRTTFESPPDVPVSKFILYLKRGSKGLLVNSRNICNQTYRSNANLRGQNGRKKTLKPVLKNSRCKKGKKK